MTISTLLAELAEQYGNGWPMGVLDRYCYLDRVGVNRARSQNEEYHLLRRWLEQTIEAGIASRQGNLTEH